MLSSTGRTGMIKKLNTNDCNCVRFFHSHIRIQRKYRVGKEAKVSYRHNNWKLMPRPYYHQEMIWLCKYCSYSEFDLRPQTRARLQISFPSNRSLCKTVLACSCWDTCSCPLCQMIGHTAECIIIVTSRLSCPVYTDGARSIERKQTVTVMTDADSRRVCFKSHRKFESPFFGVFSFASSF